MKSSFPILAALLLQAANFPSVSNAPAPQADPQHLRYVRTLTLPHGASGVACTVLDASVYAHTASASARSVRACRASCAAKAERPEASRSSNLPTSRSARVTMAW